MSYLNDDQADYVRYLNSKNPEELCWCGWCLKGKCDTPYPCDENFSKADRLKVTCTECNGYPGKPNAQMWHRPECSKRIVEILKTNTDNI